MAARLMLSRLVVSTQLFENYGAHDWDGEGQCPQYWKPKFGYDYHIMPDWFDVADSMNDQFEFNMKLAVSKAREKIELDNDLFREYIIDSRVLSPGEHTQFERDQLEYEGSIEGAMVQIEVSL